MIGYGSDRKRREDSVFFPRVAGKENGSSVDSWLVNTTKTPHLLTRSLFTKEWEPEGIESFETCYYGSWFSDLLP